MAVFDPEYLMLLLRLGFLALVYLFLLQVVLALRRDLRRSVPVVNAGSETLARLVVVESPDPALAVGQVIDLREHNSIGRAPHNAIVVNDSFASANHAMLSWRDKRWQVVDVGSTNGTFVNHKRVVESMPVEFGDIVEIGQAKFKLVR